MSVTTANDDTLAELLEAVGVQAGPLLQVAHVR